MSYYPRLDMLKFCCSIGIVCVHTNPFIAVPQLHEWFLQLQPIFVAMFFIISSSLFWQKQRMEDAPRLWHFASRLLKLVIIWGILLLPQWLPKFIRHNEDAWLTLLVPKIMLNGFAQGSWFIMSLIYGMMICYLLNRYLNRNIVFVLCAALWLYLSLVYYDGMSDFLHIYYEKPDDGFGFESYYSPVRSLIWIEAGYYLVPLINRYVSGRSVLIWLLICMVVVGFLDHGYFVADSIISVLLPAWAMREAQEKPDSRFVILRQMSIVIFFVHFLFVTIIHVLFLKGIIGFESGLVITIIVYTLSITFAFIVVSLSKRYRCLRCLH